MQSLCDPSYGVTPDTVTITPSVLYFGTPVVLIVTRNVDGSANITPMSSAWALGTRIVIGLAGTGHGVANLLREGECTLNLAAAELWYKVEAIAHTTGRDPVPAEKAAMGFVHAGDKFALGGFSPRASELVRPPRIGDCPLQLEARLVTLHGAQPDAANEQTMRILELDVVRVHAHRRVVVPGTSHIDTARWNPLLYVFRHYFGFAEKLGRTFRAET